MKTLVGVPSSTAELLDRWLPTTEVRNRTQLAERLGIGPSAISNWFSRKSKLNWTRIEQIDGALEASGAFADILRSLAIPDALAPDTRWQNNPQGDVGPRWAWVRSAVAGPLAVSARLGPFEASCEVPAGGDGVFLWSPAVPTNPAVEIVLDSPGWVAFGRGRPPDFLGVDVVDVVSRARLHGVELHHAFNVVAMVLNDLGRMQPRWLDLLSDATGVPLKILREVHASSGRRAPVQRFVRSTGELDGAENENRPAFVLLRQQRRLSQDDVVTLLRRGPDGIETSKPTIDRFESGAQTRTHFLAARLDRLYGADGRLGWWPVQARRTAMAEGYEVNFPMWWVGPVWVCFRRRENTHATAAARLDWRPWTKLLRVESGAVIGFRRSGEDSGPLRVMLPADWSMTAGMGRHPRADDGNEQWAVMPSAIPEFLDEYASAVVRAWGGSVKDTSRLLASARHSRRRRELS